jgi:hypothetical protein
MFVAGPQIDFMEGWREELSREVKKDMGETWNEVLIIGNHVKEKKGKES